MRQHWTKEQKAEFWQAFVRHRDEGCNIREAWSRARMDFQAEGKLAPGLMVFRKWYQAAMRPQREEAEQADTVDTVDTVDEVDGAGTEAAGEAAEDDGANLSDGSDGSDGSDSAGPIGPGEPEPEGPEGQPGETPELDDYTRKLEAMLRLYRRRTEADADAVCDQLLPGLFPAEEE